MNTIQTVVSQVLAQSNAAAFDPTSLVIPVLMMAGFYFLFIAPQRKRQKELEKLQSELAVGDEVIALGGIYARVVSIKEDRVTLELDTGRMTVHKSAIMGKDASAIVAQA
jgi:preprotein translocase subunit YajC